MSDRYICLFSLDPTYVPVETAQEESKALLHQLVSCENSPLSWDRISTDTDFGGKPAMLAGG